MKFAENLISVILIFCVMGIAVLGFFAMADMNNHVISACIGKVSGMNCPISTNTLADITLHVDAVQILFLATFSSDAGLLLIGMLLLLIIRAVQINESLSPTVQHFTPLVQPTFISSEHQQLHWLSLHELRDPEYTHQ